MKKGDRVILTQITSTPRENIPLAGSKYGCVGTVISSSDMSTMVKWDNGFVSGFLTWKLSLYKKLPSTNPNVVFLHKRRGKISE